MKNIFINNKFGQVSGNREIQEQIYLKHLLQQRIFIFDV